MDIHVDTDRPKISLGLVLTVLTLLGILASAVAWMVRADAAHVLAEENSEAIVILTKIHERQQAREEMEQELLGESWRQRVFDVLDREAELGTGNGRPRP